MIDDNADGYGLINRGLFTPRPDFNAPQAWFIEHGYHLFIFPLRSYFGVLV